MKCFPFLVSLFATATARVRIRERCSKDSDCTSGRCVSDGRGHNKKFICKSQLENEEDCNEDTDCISGRCETDGILLWVNKCKPQLENGEICDENSDCISNECNMFQCQYTKCSGVTGIADVMSNVLVRTTYGKSISGKSRKLLRQLDHTTVFLVAGVADSILNAEPIDHKNVDTAEVDLGWTKSDTAGFSGPWTKLPPGTRELKVSEKHTVNMLIEDDFFGGNPDDDTILTMLQKFLFEQTQNPITNPLSDTTIYEKKKKKIKILMKDIKLNYRSEGGCIADTYNEVPFTSSDASFSRFFFYGSFGVPLIAAQEKVSDSSLGPFVVDIPLHNYEMRERFRPLGARVHFDENQKATGIFDYFKEKLYVPGDKEWNNAKFLAKASAFILVTVREHLIWSHFHVSEATVYHSTLLLSPSHPLRRLLTIHTFHANSINTSAFQALVPELSALHRGVGFTHKAMKMIFDFSYETSNIFEPFESREVNSDLQKLVNKGKFPFITEGVEYYKIVKSYVTSWLSNAGDAAKDSQALAFYDAMKDSTKNMKYKIPEYSGDGSMIDLITQIIFTVTAWHEMVGYVRDGPNVKDIGARISRECQQHFSDLQTFLYYSVIAASTSVRMPFLLQEYPNFFGAGGAPAWERTLWNKFVKDLELQSAKVRKEDEIRMKDPRSHEFKHMDPARFECSVSV